jgi:carbon monoxide dehydrogenase subunit G
MGEKQVTNVTVTRRIDAPVDVVFRTVAHVEQFSQAVPHILRIEFLSEVKSGVGARFRETRRVMGSEASTELEVKEYVENERVRMVSEAGGALWDTVFTVTPDGAGTALEMVMDAQPRSPSARMTLPFIIGVVRKAVEQDMNAVKSFCERPARL